MSLYGRPLNATNDALWEKAVRENPDPTWCDLSRFLYFSSLLIFFSLLQPRPCRRYWIRRSSRTCKRSKHSILFPSSKTHRPLKPTQIPPNRTLHLQRISSSTSSQLPNPTNPTTDEVGAAFTFIDSSCTE